MEWSFLKSCLKFFGFPVKMVQWIMSCVSSASFMVSVMETCKVFLKAKEG